MRRRELLFEFKCKTCNNYFLYCVKNGNDFRCYDCRKNYSVEAIEKELKEMPKEEYESFMKDIKEYEDELEEKREERLVRKKNCQRN